MTEPAPQRGTEAERAARYADRYGTGRSGGSPARRRAIAAALTALVVVAGVGIGVLGYQKYGPKDIEAEQLGYVVVDDSTLDLRVKVTRDDPSRPVVCFVRAMTRDGEETGRREVLVLPSEHGTVEFGTVVRTSQRPASGAVYGCSASVPDYLRAG